MESSYEKGLVDRGKSCGVLVVSPLIALMHAYAGVFTQTSSVKPNPFANVTIKIDVIFTFKLNACANSVYQAFPPAVEGLGTRLDGNPDGVSFASLPAFSDIIYVLCRRIIVSLMYQDVLSCCELIVTPYTADIGVVWV